MPRRGVAISNQRLKVDLCPGNRLVKPLRVHVFGHGGLQTPDRVTGLRDLPLQHRHFVHRFRSTLAQVQQRGRRRGHKDNQNDQSNEHGRHRVFSTRCIDARMELAPPGRVPVKLWSGLPG